MQVVPTTCPRKLSYQPRWTRNAEWKHHVTYLLHLGGQWAVGTLGTCNHSNRIYCFHCRVLKVKERREKFLTAKYGSHQMALIRKRLAVEMWLYDELHKLYEPPVPASAAVSTLPTDTELPTYLLACPTITYLISKSSFFSSCVSRTDCTYTYLGT